MVARLPRIHWAVGAVAKDSRWLPKVAPLLPVTIPVPLAIGAPAEGYPWEWGVYPWLEGENPSLDAIADPTSLALDVGRFVAALHRIELRSGPRANRGVPLAERDEPTRAAIAELKGMIDTEAATSAWEAALQTPAWSAPPVWIHGDLLSGNLLLQDGRLTAVIDWGGVGLGDPACDLLVAWGVLPAEVRNVFRAELDVNDATWARGRGWALSVGLILLPYYKDTNPPLAATGRRLIHEVLADHERARPPAC
jgi:aminoglycoside phosphotransferase (APT) family kinase protein